MSISWNEVFFLTLSSFLLAMVPMIFFCLTEQNLLKNIQVKNRVVSPGAVWLQLIPVFGLFWQFIVVRRLTQSIQQELTDANKFSFEQDAYVNEDAYNIKLLYNIGMAYCAGFCLSLLPVIGMLAGLAGLVCWIIFWVKLAGFITLLQQKRYGNAANLHQV